MCTINKSAHTIKVWKHRMHLLIIIIIVGSCQGVEKPLEHEGVGGISCSGCTWSSSQRVRKATGVIGD